MFPVRDTLRSHHAPVVTYALIAANILVFLHEMRLSPEELEAFFFRFGVVPAAYHPGELFSSARQLGSGARAVFTSMFLHGGWLHIISNMWILAVFGDNVEDRVGRFRYLLFYLFCGAVAALAHLATNPGSAVPVVGASGAIAGVMGAYMFLFPHARIVTLILIIFYPIFIEVPALVFLFLWFFAQIMNGVFSLGMREHVAGIAWWAHVGGFVAGAAGYRYFRRKGPRREYFGNRSD